MLGKAQFISSHTAVDIEVVEERFLLEDEISTVFELIDIGLIMTGIEPWP